MDQPAFNCSVGHTTSCTLPYRTSTSDPEKLYNWLASYESAAWLSLIQSAPVPPPIRVSTPSPVATERTRPPGTVGHSERRRATLFGLFCALKQAMVHKYCHKLHGLVVMWHSITAAAGDVPTTEQRGQLQQVQEQHDTLLDEVQRDHNHLMHRFSFIAQTSTSDPDIVAADPVIICAQQLIHMTTQGSPGLKLDELQHRHASLTRVTKFIRDAPSTELGVSTVAMTDGPLFAAPRGALGSFLGNPSPFPSAAEDDSPAAWPFSPVTMTPLSPGGPQPPTPQVPLLPPAAWPFSHTVTRSPQDELLPTLQIANHNSVLQTQLEHTNVHHHHENVESKMGVVHSYATPKKQMVSPSSVQSDSTSDGHGCCSENYAMHESHQARLLHTVDTLGKDGSSSRVATRKRKFSAEQIAIIMDWLKDHESFPYPTNKEKDALAKAARMTRQQIGNFLINWRMRVIKVNDPKRYAELLERRKAGH